ncbi:MAG: hypothetical protein ACN23H_02185 [Candidatus Phytoplasma vitis]|nr:MAG: hypothetical protein M6G77_02140 [Candidatus Phytoplasma vitis]
MEWKQFFDKNKKIILIIFIIFTSILMVAAYLIIDHNKTKREKLEKKEEIQKQTQQNVTSLKYMNNISCFFIGDSFLTVPIIIQDVNIQDVKKNFQIKYLEDTTQENKNRYQEYSITYDNKKKLTKIERLLNNIKKDNFIKILYKESNQEETIPEIDQIQIFDKNLKKIETYVVIYNDQKQIISIKNNDLSNNNSYSEIINIIYDENGLLKTVKKTKRRKTLNIEREFKMNYNSNNKLIKIEEFNNNINLIEYKLDYNENELTKLTVLDTNKPINNFEINISNT